MRKVKVGIIGCGNISGIYLENLSKKFSDIDLVGCADIDISKAKEKAEKYGIKAMTVDEILKSSEIEIIVNLTIPQAHHEVCKNALLNGKNVYVEKPLSITREEGRELIDIANEKGLLIGGAPDTFLGAGIQTCRKIIDDGFIGTPIAATAFLMCHGHESWHPDPEFYYKVGGGPMFDMGPYYLTALINLLGPIESVTASTKITFDKRVILSQKKKGNIIDVEVPTHIAGIMNFKSGVIGTIITSFDVWGHHMPNIEIYGTEGSILVPDPNTFSGTIKVMRNTDREWKDMPLTHGYKENSRGIGVLDMAYSLVNNRKNRASGELAYHVLDTMQGFHDAAKLKKTYMLESSCEKPEALSTGIVEGFLDK